VARSAVPRLGNRDPGVARRCPALRRGDVTPAARAGTYWPGSPGLTEPLLANDIVAGQKALGYDFVKVYSRLQRSVFDAIAAAGRRHDMDVSGHVPQAVPFRHAVEAGMRTSEHFVGVLHAVFRDQSLPSPDVSPMFDEAKQFMEQVGRGEINVEGLIDWRKVKELSAWLAGRKHWLVPTHHIMRNFTDNPLPPFEAGLRYLTPEERMLVHGDVGEFFGLTEDQKKGETLMYELRTDILKAFHDAGAKIMVGTDQQTMVGLATVAEMQALEQAGMSRADALRAATTVTADYLGRSGEFGEVREGAVADLILVKGNPLKDLAALNAMLDEVSEKMAALKE